MFVYLSISRHPNSAFTIIVITSNKPFHRARCRGVEGPLATALGQTQPHPLFHYSLFSFCSQRFISSRKSSRKH